MVQIYQKLKSQVEDNQPTLLVTTCSGGKRLLTEEMLEKEILDSTTQANRWMKQAFVEGKPRYSEGILVEPFFPRERLIVLGGGHIAVPLVEIASRVGFEVTVVDDRPSFANTPRFLGAKRVLCESFTTCLGKLAITRNDYIVIITRGHKHDTDCLRQILSGPETIYVGMIGSSRRVKVVKEELIEEGYEVQKLEKVCSPIGIPIGSATPEEISISIVAQLIKRKRLDRIDGFRINRSDFDYYVLEELAQIEDQPCAIVTIIEVRGSVPRGLGAKMIVYSNGQIVGSIGGGCSEGAIMRTALEIIGTNTRLIQKIDMTAEAAEEEGMVCGGTMTVLIEDVKSK